MADVTVLDVLLYGVPIGTLTRVAGDRTLFAFNENYIVDANRPVLGLGFKDQLGELITAFRPTQTRVLPFFSNLLPESHMRTYLAERAGVNPAREFFLLWVLGNDLPGAITIRPADDEAWPPDAHDDADDEHDRYENALRFSLAGVQLKFSAPGRGARRADYSGARCWRFVDRQATLAGIRRRTRKRICDDDARPADRHGRAGARTC